MEQHLNRHEWAVAVDTVLAELSEARYLAAEQLTRAADGVHYAADDSRTYLSRTRTVWKLKLEDARAKAEATRDRDRSYVGQQAGKAVEAYDAALGHQDAVCELFREINAVYDGWTRFYLVKNADGHIHSSTGCSTLRWDTRIAWLPALSGLSEAEAVAAHGAILCTVCFPSAPVEWTNAHDLAAEAKKAARCAGSGKAPVADEKARGSRYRRCSECGTTQALTGYGVIRAHKAPAAVTA